MDVSAAKPNPRASKQAWTFMVERMPKVVERIREVRSKGNGAHLDACWRRGVVNLEPGWFWAYEAGVSVGVPTAEMLADQAVQQLLKDFPGLNLLILKDTNQDGGVHRGAD